VTKLRRETADKYVRNLHYTKHGSIKSIDYRSTPISTPTITSFLASAHTSLPLFDRFTVQRGARSWPTCQRDRSRYVW